MSDRRLIEEYLPVAEVSYESTREKLLRRRDYHLSTLHLWWARRPLAASRAAVYAALTNTPRDIDVEKLAPIFKTLCEWPVSDSAVRKARAEILAANDGVAPKVLDPFAGGGAIPLEATRLGCETTALELNPVAHLIELCTLDFPQRFGASLAEDVRRWGRWLIERAREEVGHLYPAPPGEPEQGALDGLSSGSRRVPIAYLWTRTVPCPNPAERPHAVPLVRQTWLVKKSNRSVALRMVPDRASMTVAYEVVESRGQAGLGFDPAGFSERGSTTCPLCGASVTLDYVKSQGTNQPLGAELMAVGLLRPGQRGKNYVSGRAAAILLPDSSLVEEVLDKLAKRGLEAPSENVCAEDNQAFLVPKYGLTRFGDLFTRRQLAMLLTLCRLVRESYEEMLAEGIERERAKAVATYLGLLVDRMTDRHSTLCTWDNSKEGISSTFSRQALPMTWDYIEANPFGGSGGDLSMHVDSIAKVIEHCSVTGLPANVIRGSATELPFESGEFDAVITDPPYYDNVPYSDVSDYFYVWLKRSVGHLYPEHLTSDLAPKRAEIVASRYRNEGSRDAARAAYEGMMSDALSEARRVLKSSGVLVCVYAHQTTAGWATLIEAVRNAGFMVVEAWPLDTEMPTRDIAQDKGSLASSIVLVARPRAETRIGDWAHEVRPELQTIVARRVERLSQLVV